MASALDAGTSSVRSGGGKVISGVLASVAVVCRWAACVCRSRHTCVRVRRAGRRLLTTLCLDPPSVHPLIRRTGGSHLPPSLHGRAPSASHDAARLCGQSRHVLSHKCARRRGAPVAHDTCGGRDSADHVTYEVGDRTRLTAYGVFWASLFKVHST